MHVKVLSTIDIALGIVVLPHDMSVHDKIAHEVCPVSLVELLTNSRLRNTT